MPAGSGDRLPRVRATHADHDGGAARSAPAPRRSASSSRARAPIYFAGDTDLFPEMAEIGPVDVALLPVSGWGPNLPPGHLDARVPPRR